MLHGIEEACRIKKNIFQKSFIKGKDLFRKILDKIRNHR